MPTKTSEIYTPYTKEELRKRRSAARRRRTEQKIDRAGVALLAVLAATAGSLIVAKANRGSYPRVPIPNASRPHRELPAGVNSYLIGKRVYEGEDIVDVSKGSKNPPIALIDPISIAEGVHAANPKIPEVVVLSLVRREDEAFQRELGVPASRIDPDLISGEQGAITLPAEWGVGNYVAGSE